ncbi:NAD-dependent dehydratase, partial [Burkholderia multivorans]
MSDSDRVVILGGHGKVALLAAPKLTAAGFAVDSVIRNPDQAADVEAA